MFTTSRWKSLALRVLLATALAVAWYYIEGDFYWQLPLVIAVLTLLVQHLQARVAEGLQQLDQATPEEQTEVQPPDESCEKEKTLI